MNLSLIGFLTLQIAFSLSPVFATSRPSATCRKAFVVTTIWQEAKRYMNSVLLPEIWDHPGCDGIVLKKDASGRLFLLMILTSPDYLRFFQQLTLDSPVPVQFEIKPLSGEPIHTTQPGYN